MFKEAFNLLSNLLNKEAATPLNYRSEKSSGFIEAVTGDLTNRYEIKLKDLDAGQELLAAAPEEQLAIVLDLADWLTTHENEMKEKRKDRTFYSYNNGAWNVRAGLVELLRKKLPFEEDELLQLFEWSMIYDSNFWRATPQIIKQTQDFQKNGELSPKLIAKIEAYIEILSKNNYSDSQTRQDIGKLREMAGLAVNIPLAPGEAWSDFAIEQIKDLKETERNVWIELLNHCVFANGSVPTTKWRKAGDAIIEKIGWVNYKQAVLRWLPLIEKTRTQKIETWSEWSPDPNLLINDNNADILKGLIWLCTGKNDREVFRVLSLAAISAYRKVPKLGPRCVRVGNACVWALGEMNDSEAVGQLALLKVRIKFGTAQKLIETALEKAAVRAGLPKEEIEEISVPDYGLQEVGHLTEKIGDYTAKISIIETDKVTLQWFSAAGKLLKSVPSGVKKEWGEEIAELNQTLKDIRQMLPAQRNRIDGLYLEQKKWEYDVWRERYLDHPLVGTLARRLIWKFMDDAGAAASGIWLDGKLVAPDGKEIGFPDEKISVALWHPLDETTESVLAWREFLEQNLIRQPFKQAHREIYILTEAERKTRVYSNRYAAHILKQHQFNALCAARGWKNKLRLMVDDNLPPAMRALPKWNLRAEFWVEGIGENYGADTNETGTYLYLTTDQVRFYPADARENSAHAAGGGYGSNVWGTGNAVDSIQLEEIPPLVFSEIMRDVDLFVGVASVGNDPNWLDTGVDGSRRNYWYDYSFGELSVSAKTRQQILEKLIPRLKIADRCSFDDRFLIVKGDIRTYKIHLGSGNILMKPNDQYLCIVASQGTADANKVFLPFEGDQRVAVILSKAFLLAEDTKIDDKTILRQLK